MIAPRWGLCVIIKNNTENFAFCEVVIIFAHRITENENKE